MKQNRESRNKPRVYLGIWDIATVALQIKWGRNAVLGQAAIIWGRKSEIENLVCQNTWCNEVLNMKSKSVRKTLLIRLAHGLYSL